METHSHKLEVTIKEEPGSTAIGGDPEKMEGTTDKPKKKRIYKPLSLEKRLLANERRREQRAKMKPEQKARECQRKKRKLVVETPEEREERRAKRRFHLYLKRLEMTDEQRKALNQKNWLQKQARIAQMTEEEREEMRRKNREAVYSYYRNIKVLKGEMLEKHRKMVNESARNKWRKNPDKMLAYLRKKVAEETPMQRKKRLRGYKINQRRRQMKKEMEKEGLLDEEEIERRLRDWVKLERGKPLSPVREEEMTEYKPRLSGRKPKEGSKRWREIYEGRPRTPPPAEGRRKRRSCYRLPKVPPENKETLVPKSPPSLFGGDGGSRMNMGSPPPSHQICIVNPSPADLVPDEEEAMAPPSPCNSFGGDDYPDAGSPPSSPQGYQYDTAIPHIEEEEPPEPLPSPPPIEVLSSTSIWKCPLCPTPIPSLSSLPLHLRVHHPLHHSSPKYPKLSPPSTTSPFQCILCPWPSSSPPIYLQFQKSCDLLSHVYLHHPTSYYPCPKCPLLYYSSSRLSLHLLHCSKTKIPSKNSSSSKTPIIPSKSPPAPLPRRICEDCGRTYKNNAAYNFHQRHSHPSKIQRVPLACPKCPRVCVNLRAFWIHFTQCGLKTLKRRPNPPLPSEDRRYSSDGPHLCFQCSKTFVQKATLDDHIRREHLGLTHQCPQCLKNFQSAGKLWRHQVEYHGISPENLEPPPRCQEATNCKYCGLLIMRGYEQHVQKIHPEEISDFRENVLPEVKQRQEEFKAKRVKGSGGGGGESGKVACLYCPAILTEHSLKRHMRNQHDMSEEVRCQDCNKVYRDQEKYEAHLAQTHAYQEMEEIFKREKLICELKKMRDGKMLVGCQICGLELPYPDKYSVRVHFVISHFDKVTEYFDESGKKR